MCSLFFIAARDRGGNYGGLQCPPGIGLGGHDGDRKDNHENTKERKHEKGENIMTNVETIRELVRDLERGCDAMDGGLNLEEARKMMVVSECITANIQAYLFKFLAGGGQ